MRSNKETKTHTERKRKQRSTKGALSKGMLRRLPSAILESPLFAERFREIMRRYVGIYALYRRDRLYYIGLTKNLIQRVRYLKDIETLIHHLVDILGNKIKGKVPRDADLNRILREVLREHETAIRGIRRALR